MSMPTIVATAAAVATVFVATPVSGAAEPVSKPAPCNGKPLISDAAGDAQGGVASMDVTAVFFTTAVAADGKVSVAANLEIANLDKAPPPQAPTGAVFYQVSLRTPQGPLQALRAVNDQGAFRFEYDEHFPQDTIGYWLTQPTTGRLFDGPGGVVQIDLPDTYAKLGARFTDVVGMTDVGQNSTQRLVLGKVAPSGDYAPDDIVNEARTFTVDECRTAPPAAVPATTVAPSPTRAAKPKPAARRTSAQRCRAKARRIKNTRKRRAALRRCARKAGRR